MSPNTTQCEPTIIQTNPGDPPPKLNGPILVATNCLKEVVSSAAEAELGGLFHNGKDAVPLCTLLKELVFPQSIR